MELAMKNKLAISCAFLSALVALPAVSQSANDSIAAEASQMAAVFSRNMDNQALQDGQIAAASMDAATYTEDEIAQKAALFFGKSSQKVGAAVAKIFKDQGEPVGYIQGTEYAGAIGIGLRYGNGMLIMKDGSSKKVYWQGPSIGFDSGGNASKVFTLVYNLENPGAIYRRYPGVEGAAFFIAGLSVTYQQAEGVVLAPMRTGVGLRAGANAGYTSYSSKFHLNPL
jgi:hypothetical protein